MKHAVLQRLKERAIALPDKELEEQSHLDQCDCGCPCGNDPNQKPKNPNSKGKSK